MVAEGIPMPKAPWKRHKQPAREPRALLVKYSRGEDFYVAWSESGEAPIWCGTRAQAAAFGYTPERIERADTYGTSSAPMIDAACTIPWSGGRFYDWDANGMIAEQRGFLPRRLLRAYALLYLADELQAAFDLLEPIDASDPDFSQVRRD